MLPNWLLTWADSRAMLYLCHLPAPKLTYGCMFCARNSPLMNTGLFNLSLFSQKFLKTSLFFQGPIEAGGLRCVVGYWVVFSFDLTCPTQRLPSGVYKTQWWALCKTRGYTHFRLSESWAGVLNNIASSVIW